MIAVLIRLAHSRGHRLLIAALIAGATGLLATPALALAAPELGIAMTHANAYGAQAASCPGGRESLPGEQACGVDPYTGSGTTFDRESGFNAYTITVTNTGNPAASGVVSVTDQLPAGLTLAGEGPQSARPEVSGSGWACTIASPGAVTCTRSDGLAEGASYPPITLHVHVEPEAPLGSPPGGGVTNTATVEGGGASPASAGASDPTTIAEVPFGIQGFTTSVTESLGNPFTQAGGHPFAASATFVFNYVPDDFGTLKTAGGSPKDIETELPPGFVGSPQQAPKCPVESFETKGTQTPCPPDTAVGYIEFSYSQGKIEDGKAKPFCGCSYDPVYNVVPGPGYPAAFGFVAGVSEAHFTLNAKVRSDGDYGITVSSPYTTTPTLLAASLTFCENGVTDEGPSYASTLSCAPVNAALMPFLTNPTRCEGPAPSTRLSADTYEDPGDYASVTSYTGAPSGEPSFVGQPGTTAAPNAGTSFVTGCDGLSFEPRFVFEPESTQAEQPTGMAVDLNVPQPEEENTTATPGLKDATVTLPEGMSVDPAAADGLEACSDAQFGAESTVEPAVAAVCPVASQLGTVRIVSPLLEKPLEGEVFLGEPECSPCTTADAEDGRIFRLFLQAQGSGVIVKVAGRVSANPVTGRLTATFQNQPQLPFNVLELKFKGGPRAPLENPQSCGAAIVGWDMTPWSAPGLGGLSGEEQIAGTPDAIVQEPSFDVDWDGHGGACPASLPFGPSFVAGMASPAAGAYSDLAVTLARPEPPRESEERDEQNLAGVTVVTPPGLLGRIAGVPLCEEPQASAGTCPAASQIGTVTAGAGPGSDPFYVGGKVYLTGPYKGQPFGLSIVVAAVAGPFNLGTVVVRASIAVNPTTAALTVTSDPFPQIVDGVPLRLHKIRVEVNRPGFMFNPTSCSAQLISATISGEHVNAGEANASSPLSSAFAAQGCKGLAFKPQFTVSTSAKTSKADGASLTAKVSYPSAPQGAQADIAAVKVDLPKQLPSRLTTLQKACTNAQFEANPADCPAASKIGYAVVHTPILPVPLEGPAIFVSHGGEAFPSLTLVLQGDNVTVDLVGSTFISKAGITSTTFKTVPDAPFSTFELVLPEGPYSALAANGSLCKPVNTVTVKKKVTVKVHGRKQKLTRKVKESKPATLLMPTAFVAQNGAEIHESTPISVTGCAPAITVTSHKVTGRTATIQVQVPSAGTLVATASAIKRSTKRVAKAGTVTIGVGLSSHDLRVLAKNPHQRVNVDVKLRFTSKHGAPLTAHVRLLMG